MTCQLVATAPTDILIVEDDLQLACMFSKHLSPSSLKTHHFDTVASALAYLQTNAAPRIAIIDLHIAGSPSIDVVAALQKPRQQRKTIVIVVLGAAHDRDLPLYQSWTDFVLVKPISARQLATLVSTLLHGAVSIA